MAEETMEMPDGMAVEACSIRFVLIYNMTAVTLNFQVLMNMLMFNVAFRGACAGCMMATEDFSSGIKLLLMDEVPGIRDVILVG